MTSGNLSQLMHKRVPLRPELERCLKVSPLFDDESVQSIKHPLIIEPFYTAMLNAVYNARLEGKQRAAREALRANDIARYVWAFEEPYRPDALRKWFKYSKHTLPPEHYWRLVPSLWVQGEFMVENDYHTMWTPQGRVAAMVGTGCSDTWRMSMGTKERAVLDALTTRGELVTVYRGEQTTKRYPARAWSWTLSRERALWFASRFGHGLGGHLLTGRVLPRHVIAFLGVRGEREVVVNPRHVDVHRVTPIAARNR